MLDTPVLLGSLATGETKVPAIPRRSQDTGSQKQRKQFFESGGRKPLRRLLEAGVMLESGTEG